MTPKSRIVVDTSVAVPLLLQSHRAHTAVSAWAAGRRLGLSGHVMVETYSVLTRLPGDARVSPADAVELIDNSFPDNVFLPVDLLMTAHRELAHLGVTGGATYDGLVALAARESGVPLATSDARARPTYERVGVSVEIVD